MTLGVVPPPVQSAPPTSKQNQIGKSILDGLLDGLPAWLISCTVHIVAMLLASMWLITAEKEDSWITLSTTVSEEELEGEAIEFESPLVAPPIEDPGKVTLEPMVDVQPPGQPEVTVDRPVVADVPAVGDQSEAEDVPEPSDVSDLPSSLGSRGSLAGRDPAMRAEILKREGGTSETEAAVALGLQWLARHQNGEGSWSLHAFHRAPKATSPPDGLGQESDISGTAMALLPFLGAGSTHRKGEYRYEVDRGLKWLVAQQQPDGDLRGSGVGRMYAHGQATIVLCEAYAMSGDRRLREPAQKAVDFIIRAQHPAGGWRYTPGEAGDTSVLGWQLMALRSGKMAYLKVPNSVFQLASRYLDRAKADRYGGLYGYMPGHLATPAMTAEGLLCRQYLGWPKNNPGLQNGVRFLLKDYLPREASPDIYYWYYATQVMHHMGGRSWDTWNRQMRKLLVNLQRVDGGLAGSWDPRGPFASTGGRIYMTALAICCLEVYYRYLPMYQSDVMLEAKKGKDEG